MNAKPTGSARTRDQDFSKIFNEYHFALCYFAEGLLKDHSLAKDVVSTVFEKLLSTGFPLDIQSQSSYLYKAVYNGCQNLKEERATRDKYQTAAGNTLAPIDDAILERIYRAEVYRELFGAIDQLPEQCRRVMHLSYREGLKVDEIAQLLQVSSSTVKTQRTIGIKRLRRLLSDAAFLMLLTL